MIEPVSGVNAIRVPTMPLLRMTLVCNTYYLLRVRVERSSHNTSFHVRMSSFLDSGLDWIAPGPTRLNAAGGKAAYDKDV